MTARRTTFLFTALGLLTAALFIADLAVGSVAVPLGDVWAALTGGSCDPATSDIILKIRLLKAVTALFAGAALAAGGLEMQTLFRNPLAGPYVLGVSSGAGLGVALFLLGAPLLGVAGHSFVRSLGVAGAAWLGSALVLAIVMAVSRRIKDIMVILILGMMLGSGISSVVEILQYLSSEAALKSFVIWTMGSLGDVTGGNLMITMLAVLFGSAVISSFLDNIPFVATMIPIILTLEADGLDGTALWWALSLGACLGGNGTLIGASANVVLSDISKKFGHEITFMQFFKRGFPIMLFTVAIAAIYMVIRFPGG